VDEALQSLVTLSVELQLPMTLDELLQRALTRVGQLVDTKRASIRLFDAARAHLFLGARLGEPVHQTPYEQQPGQGLLGWVAQHGRPIRTGNAEADPRYMARPGMKEPLVSFLGMPIIYQGHTIGVISAVHGDKDRFTERHESLLRIVAGLCASHLEVARLARIARLDPLTGALNHDTLETVFPDIAADEPLRQVSVLLVDVDSFTATNDRFGRAIGDEVLRVTARVLVGSLRIGDAVVRYGDDAFVLMVPGVGLMSASRIAERARAAVCAAPVRIGDLSVTPSVCIGVAERAASESRDDLLRRAQAALDAARRQGTNQVRMATL
jgi:diguanylate cyclase (GGDEF)-like protein